jgi:hypothetical protein
MSIQQNLLAWLESAWIKACGEDENFRRGFSAGVGFVTWAWFCATLGRSVTSWCAFGNG